MNINKMMVKVQKMTDNEIRTSLHWDFGYDHEEVGTYDRQRLIQEITKQWIWSN